jgi:hypothetical protein
MDWKEEQCNLQKLRSTYWSIRSHPHYSLTHLPSTFMLDTFPISPRKKTINCWPEEPYCTSSIHQIQLMVMSYNNTRKLYRLRSDIPNGYDWPYGSLVIQSLDQTLCSMNVMFTEQINNNLSVTWDLTYLPYCIAHPRLFLSTIYEINI